MSDWSHGQLNVLKDIVCRFDLSSLQPALQACEALIRGAPIDVAVLGQFKAGKSSLLNAVLGDNLFPVGVLPVTSVITRAQADSSQFVRVNYLDGSSTEAPLSSIADFVTERGNEDNRRRVAAVDIFTPAMQSWPGIRLVDTPGLGSVFLHNTETTRSWLPNVAAALVVISAERPLSDEDRRLVAEARATAPRVVVVLNKVDLLTNDEMTEVAAFIESSLRQALDAAIPLLAFSARVDCDRWVRRLRESVLGPVAANVAAERSAALALKMGALVKACHGYLTVGLCAAESADADRERLRMAVFTESVKSTFIQDELRLAQGSVCDETRPAFTNFFLVHQSTIAKSICDALASDLQSWQGNLAKQTRRYESWMAERLAAELSIRSETAIPVAGKFFEKAEERFQRIVEGFRDRLGRNVREAMQINIAPIAWKAQHPALAVVPVALSLTFMTQWELLWWLLPMKLIGGLFRRHLLERVPWEVQKNLIRLAGDWAGATDRAIVDLCTEAIAWVEAELFTLERLLRQTPPDAVRFRKALEQCEDCLQLLSR